jgi:hypothetical protein
MTIEQAPAFRSGVGANFFNHFNMSWRKGWDSNPRGSVNSLAVFKTAAFNRSATLPSLIHRHSRSAIRRPAYRDRFATIGLQKRGGPAR